MDGCASDAGRETAARAAASEMMFRSKVSGPSSLRESRSPVSFIFLIKDREGTSSRCVLSPFNNNRFIRQAFAMVISRIAVAVELTFCRLKASPLSL